MPMSPFDTFLFAKELKRAGISDAQIEAQVTALSQALKNCTEKYPTKQDFNEAVLKLQGSIDSLSAEFKFMKWVGGVCITGIATMLFRSF